jgi:hypothetical protein
MDYVCFPKKVSFEKVLLAGPERRFWGSFVEHCPYDIVSAFISSEHLPNGRGDC